ncbi:MAG: hypothetical protein JXQ23_12615 [Clostridia bacterium]|nr:hypothetical protein [Clostridia bacterium]
MWINPYENRFNDDFMQIRSNFHTHAGQIDGCSVNTIADTTALYEKLGYGLLCISNHNRFTPMQQTNKPDMPMKFLDGYEHTCEQHMLCLGVNKEYDITLPYQDIIDDVNKNNGLVILCHPNWIREDFWTNESLLTLTDYSGIEIVNGVISRLEGSGIATKEWDMLLTAGKKVWGFGTDDYHWQSDAGKAFTMILSRLNSPDDCLKAINEGAHYASTGLKLVRLSVEGNRLYCEASRMIKTHLKNYTYRFYGKEGILLKEDFAPSSYCELKKEYGYIRIQVINEEGKMLWTQPVYVEQWFD